MKSSCIPHDVAECMRWATNTAFLPWLPGLYSAAAMNRVYEEACRVWYGQFRGAVAAGCKQVQGAMHASADAPEGVWPDMRRF